MDIAIRMKKVREVRGWQQDTVASSLKISAQAFSFLEQGSGSPRIELLTRFCQVMGVQLHYLLALDVPVTEETMREYGSMSFSEFISDHARLKNGVEVFDQFLSGDILSPLTKSLA